MAVGIPPDLTDTAVAVKKGVTPLATATATSTTVPTTGEIWPRGSKTAAG